MRVVYYEWTVLVHVCDVVHLTVTEQSKYKYSVAPLLLLLLLLLRLFTLPQSRTYTPRELQAKYPWVRRL